VLWLAAGDTPAGKKAREKGEKGVAPQGPLLF
jgi:hypothetical protein